MIDSKESEWRFGDLTINVRMLIGECADRDLPVKREYASFHRRCRAYGLFLELMQVASSRWVYA